MLWRIISGDHFWKKREAYFEDKRTNKPRKREQRVSQFTVKMDVDENGNQSGDDAMDIDDLRKFLFFKNNNFVSLPFFELEEIVKYYVLN